MGNLNLYTSDLFNTVICNYWYYAPKISTLEEISLMNKKLLSERDICTKFISPAIESAGWNKQTQYLEEVFFTDGKIYVKGRLTARGVRKRADFILYM